MGVFAYRATDIRQQPLSGTIAADTPAHARYLLRAQGLLVAEVQPASATFKTAWPSVFAGFRRRVSDEALTEFWRDLAVLLRAGVPLGQAIDTCRRQQRGPLVAKLHRLQDDIRQGRSLADSLRQQPELGGTLASAMVRVGEYGGTLPHSLQQLAEYRAQQRYAANRLSTALVYPSILVIVGTAVVAFLVTYVVPQLAELLLASGRLLPWPTRVLLGVSGFVSNHYVWLVGGLIAVLLTWAAVRRRPWVRRVVESITYRVPIWGDLQRKSHIAQISGMLSTMLTVDVRFTEALRIVRDTVPGILFGDELGRLQQSLEAGAGLGEPLRGSRLVPPLVAHLLAVGQASGELPVMLAQLREHYDAEVQRTTQRLLAAMEPALILVLASIVGFVVFATLLPILDATQIAQ